jgi:tetratricopeptide (TPR) repeat protein
MSAFGDALIRLMMARGLGVQQLARTSHYSAGHISNLRSGAKQASPECAAELGDLLDDGGELVALAGKVAAAPLGDATMDSPRAMLYPSGVTPADDVNPIDHLRDFRKVLSDSDNLFGPGRIIPIVREQIKVIQQLRYGLNGASGRDLLCLQAQYAETLAWLCQDCADFRGAQYWLDRALEWSHMAGDQQWTAFTLARKSQLAGDMHDPIGAIDLAEAAVRLASKGTKIRAAGAAYKAHGHALADDAVSCLRTLDEAHEIAAAKDDDPAAPWVPWLSTGYVEIQRARCLTTLGDHQQAAQLFRDAIADIPPSLRRDRGVYIAREAMAHANANDPEQAADAGMRALAIAQITHSGRITTELRRLDTALRRWKTVPRASEFRDAFGGAILRETRTRGRERGRRP